MTPLEILRAARERISDPARWTRESLAKTAGGEETFALDAKAICWCTVGSVFAARGPLTAEQRAFAVLTSSLPRRFYGQISRFNDDPTTTHADVLALFDRAIARAS